MPDTYPVGVFTGDRGEKKMVRWWLYQYAISRVGKEEFTSQHHIVLGGRGGDINVLIDLGVPPENIHVAEWTRSYVRALRRQYPLVPIYKEDVILTAARLWDKEICTVNLDFCGKLRRETLDRICGVTRQIRKGVLLAVTLCGSREQEPAMHEELARFDDEEIPAHRRSRALVSLMQVREFIKPLVGIGYTSGAEGHTSAMVTTVMEISDHNEPDHMTLFEASSVKKPHDEEDYQ